MCSDSCGCREEWRGEVTPAEARLSVRLGEDTLSLDTSATSDPGGQSSQRRVLGPALAALRFRPAPATEETRRVLEEELGNCDQLLELGECDMARLLSDSIS